MAANNTQQRKVITFAQLLSKAKASGFRGVKTEIVQLPTEANHYVAVMRATVTMHDSIGDMHFDGTGEATMQNVQQAMQTCLPRIAETRAIVRALKLAVGVGDVAAEELADFDETEIPAATATPQKQRPLPEGPITPDQMSAIVKICNSKGLTADTEARSFAQVTLENLSYAQAGQLIPILSKRPAVTA